MGDSSTVYNALSGTQAVTCEVGPGTYWGPKSRHGFALAVDLKQGDVIYLSCHIAIKSVTGLKRIGFEPVINGQLARCWLENPTGDFDGIITKSYTVSADVPAGTNLIQPFAYIQPLDGKTFTVADGGYARVDHLMMSIGQPAAWAPAEGETLYNALSGTQAVTCEVGPGTYWGPKSKHGFALATDLKQGDVIYLSCHIALKSVTGLRRIGFVPVINGQYCGCWYITTTIDFDGIITNHYTVSADVPAGTNLIQPFAYIQPLDGKTFTVADGGYARVDHLMMSIGQPAAWAPAEGETLTADGGGGGMTEPTNLAKTQPDETHLYSATVASGGHVAVWGSDTYGFTPMSLSANTDVHAAITIKSKSGTLDAGTVYLSINYTDTAGHSNWMTTHNAIGVGASWTRIEMTVTIPAGMTIAQVAVGLSKTASLYMTNLTVYPLTGGRIVRARGATAGYISKAKEATVLYTPSKSARQVRVILLDETGSSIYDIQSVAIVADAEELQGKVAAQESSIQTIQSDMTTVQSGLSGLNVRLASMQTELAGVSAGDVLYQVPYTVTDGKATFTAAVYKAGVECHTSYDPSCFTWYRKTEAGTVKIGTGYSVTVNVTDVGYGGFVVGVFETQ